MERVLAAGLALATLMVMPAFLATPSPAGACSIMCVGDAQDLSEVRVTLVSGDKEAEAPQWPDTGRMFVTTEGVPDSLAVEGFAVTLYADEVE
jgi:hypothetical protein